MNRFDGVGLSYCCNEAFKVYPGIPVAARNSCNARRKYRSLTRGLEAFPKDM